MKCGEVNTWKQEGEDLEEEDGQEKKEGRGARRKRRNSEQEKDELNKGVRKGGEGQQED